MMNSLFLFRLCRIGGKADVCLTHETGGKKGAVVQGTKEVKCFDLKDAVQ